MKLRILQTVGRTPWMWDKPAATPIPTYDNGEKVQTYFHILGWNSDS
jgi:hypothetical protein